MDTVMEVRALNRALLARQMLLSKVRLPAIDVIERLVGMQSQTPNAPYFGLWTRIEGFRQDELSELILNKVAVRIALMRSTIHLVSARDCLELRPLVQTVLDRGFNGSHRKRLPGVDVDELAAAGRALVEDQPLTFSELGKRLSEARWPEHEPDALAAAIRTSVPLVQVPPRGLWGKSGQAEHTSVEAWLGQPLAAQPDAERIVLRYLAAFGPASVKDVQTWSGLTQLSKVIERLRPQLITLRDEQGAELFDLPDAPRPVADYPAPPRFVGEFDNILLSHADRRRIIGEDIRKRVFTVNGIIRPTILLDGFVCGIWRLERERGNAKLAIEPFRKLAHEERGALAEEGERLLKFAADGEAYDIRFIE